MSGLLVNFQANGQARDWGAEEMYHVEAEFWRLLYNDRSFQLEQVLYSYDVADSSLPLDEEVEAGVEETAMDRELEVAGKHEEQLEVPSPRVLDKKAMDRELEVAEEQKGRLEVPYPGGLDKKAMLTRIRRVWVAAVMTHEHSQRVSETPYVTAILPVCFES